MSNAKVIEMFYIENDTLLPVEEMKPPEGVKKQVYEVLRVIGGKPLFWEDHFARFLKSCELSVIETLETKSLFYNQLARLITVNRLIEGNIRLDLFQQEAGATIRYSLIPHKYPSPLDYQQGVEVGLFHAMRENPQAKVVLPSVRERANQLIAEKRLYEVLLVDQRGLITEGSRSNVFFLKEGRFFTPPASQVLPGITRMKVIDCMGLMNAELEETAVPVDELNRYEAVFLTGTSVGVLPVSVVEGDRFSVENELLHQLIVTYNRYVDDYLMVSPWV
ncbi:aminotransferase class IV [Gaoshiqia sp. Z1-71]|uniref:aminotransferase class IV n=1 Tax=Gaoshiqia hydrogeniformans TaxID=3290090 RepID=UPI003BF88EC0